MQYGGTDMRNSRLEAFSDGVIAIIITIMVLELKAPHGATVESLVPLIPNFLSYVLSFIYVGIYWNNHHHLLQTCEEVTGQILWANLHLLFWLSLFPITTAWIGENHLAAAPSALYWPRVCTCWWRCSGSCRIAASNTCWFANRCARAAEGTGPTARGMCTPTVEIMRCLVPTRGRKAGIWHVGASIGTIRSCSMSS